MAARPSANVKMIPVGPIMGKLLSETALSAIPVDDLYEDSAPHGRPTLYFLASLIVYSAIYNEQPPADYQAPSVVNERVAANFSDIRDVIWSELLRFKDDAGNSRVW